MRGGWFATPSGDWGLTEAPRLLCRCRNCMTDHELGEVLLGRAVIRDRINDLAAELQSFPPGQPLDEATWEDWWTRLLRIAQEA